MNFPMESAGWQALISELALAAAKRLDLVARIKQMETNLGLHSRELHAARETVRDEEYSSAQVEGGMAVASEEARRKVADCELLVKTVQLRIDGLRKTLAPLEADIASQLLPRLKALNEGFLDEVSEASSTRR